MTKFEEFLMERHAEEYTGFDDSMPNDFDNWICKLDPDQWLNYGEWFGNKLVAETLKKQIKNLEEKKEPPMTPSQ